MEVRFGPGHIALDGNPAFPTKGAQQPPLSRFTASVRINRGPCLLWPNGWMDQDTTRCGGRPWPMPHCVRWGPSYPKRAQPPPHFSVHVTYIVAKRLNGSRCHLVRR